MGLKTDMEESFQRSGQPPAVVAWFTWGLGALFYLYGFYQRVAPAVMTDQLMNSFGLSASALGNLSAFYFYSYVAMQIPTGLLADRWGPRRVQFFGALVAAIGSFCFALGPTFGWAALGRFLIGGAVGIAYVSLLKVAAHWFPANRFATISGLALLAGIIGAVSAGPPLRYLVELFGWRAVMMASGLFILAVAMAIFIFVRDDPRDRGYKGFLPAELNFSSTQGGMMEGLKSVFKYRNTWLLALAPSGIVGPVLSFSGLWGVPYLTQRFGLSPAKSAMVTSALLVAWAISGPVLGALSDRIGKRKPLYLCGAIISLVGWCAALYLPGLTLWMVVSILIIVGLGAGGMIIGFAYAKESVPPHLAGTVSGVCNMGVMIGPMIMQPLMGVILDHFWEGLVVHGVRIYSLHAYNSAFLVAVLWGGLGAMLLAFTSETNCIQMQSG